jgi:hypothetical protein
MADSMTQQIVDNATSAMAGGGPRMAPVGKRGIVQPNRNKGNDRADAISRRLAKGRNG